MIARTEALIAGLGQNEALRRGAAYVEAGADTLLIHSKQTTPDEILALPSLAGQGADRARADQLSAAIVQSGGDARQSRLVICGNHAIRSAVAAMRGTFRRILAEGGIAEVEGEIASVEDVFALQGDAYLREVEKAYLR